MSSKSYIDGLELVLYQEIEKEKELSRCLPEDVHRGNRDMLEHHRVHITYDLKSPALELQ